MPSANHVADCVANALSRPATAALTPPAAEAEFYGSYPWCLNAFPSVGEAIAFLRQELRRLGEPLEDWQGEQVRQNIFLLACLIAEATDEFLLGPRYDFLRAARVFRSARLAAGPLDRFCRGAALLRDLRWRRVARWRDQWEEALTPFAAPPAARAAGPEAGAPLRDLLAQRLPPTLLAWRARVPAAFRSQDLTPHDAWTLARKFIAAYSGPRRPVLVAGLRTAGAYFAPLVRSCLLRAGFSEVHALTLRPKAGVSAREERWLRRMQGRGALALLVDEPVYSADTVARGIDLLRRAGFGVEDIVALFPVHPYRRDWRQGAAGGILAAVRSVTLEPGEWHKVSLLRPEAIRERLAALLDGAPCQVAPALDRDAELAASQEPGFHARLKRVFAVTTPGAAAPFRVLAKSVGWGWLSYHAFLAGTRLASCVPHVLSLRDGVLLEEWVDPLGGQTEEPRESLAAAAATYVAARASTLALPLDPTPPLARAGQHRGVEELAAVLSGAYGNKVAAVLARPRLRVRLSRLLACARPALLDGKMRPEEWIARDGHWLKTDFEHHGMGKHQLNVTDPAYDLAEAALTCRLTEEQEEAMVTAYARASGDTDVSRRLLLYQLLSGTWAMARAADGLRDAAQSVRHTRYHQRYRDAAEFLTLRTARFCARVAQPAPLVAWRAPVVMLDVDGVLDKQVFGFPSTTAAGIRAISLLRSHGFTIALNTARPAAEMRAYCDIYGCAGGVAEYGAYVWDAISGRERVLLSDSSLRQLERLRAELAGLPGVFCHEGCRFCVRAYTFARGVPVPLPETLVRGLLHRLGLHGLQLHQTFTDSTITAVDSDKGQGLRALLQVAGRSHLETIAVGDTEADLPMFQAANRAFAPAQVSCPEAARRLGCHIATRAWQPGLHEIVRRIVHPQGASCSKCLPLRHPNGPAEAFFLRLLHLADQPATPRFLRVALDPLAIEAFRL